MLNRLAMLGLLLLLAPICAREPAQGMEGQQQGPPQRQTETPRPIARQPCASEVCRVDAEDAERYAYYKAHPKEYLEAAIAPANLSNWTLAALGAIGEILALGTLLAIKRQTKHMVTSERAWIVINSAMGDYRPTECADPQFRWSIRNSGRTIARVIETQCVYELVLKGYIQGLPPEPSYQAPIELHGLPLPPDANMSFTAYLVEPPKSSRMEELTREDVDTIHIGNFRLLAYGYVRYLDAFGKRRESRFCECYIWPSEGIADTGFRPMLDVPPAYTRHK